eukprot:PhM_4_TR16754/c2_g1_i1/m.26667
MVSTFKIAIILVMWCFATSKAVHTPILQDIGYFVELSPNPFGLDGIHAPAVLRRGQEFRVTLTTRYSNRYFVNATHDASRLRVIAAFPQRSHTGQIQQCNGSNVDVWQEARDLSTRSYAVGGGDLTRQGHATFVAPPFPFRVCFYHYHMLNLTYPKTWQSPLRGAGVVHTNASSAFYELLENVCTGEYFGMRIVANGDAWPYALRYPSSSRGTDGDSVKLVPRGMPCTYEQTRAVYCGSHVVGPTGEWVDAGGQCRRQGAPEYGVGAVGTNALNPIVDTFASGSTRNLVAYFRAPTYGLYDVCFSPMDHRSALRSSNISAPVWFKLFQLRAVDGCSATDSFLYNPHCVGKKTWFQVSNAGGNAFVWSSSNTDALSWAALRVRDRRNHTVLRSGQTTSWDGTNEYYRTNGDVLRLVPTRSPQATAYVAGSFRASVDAVYLSSSRGLFGESGERYVGHREFAPSVGTLYTDAGCWARAYDRPGKTVATSFSSNERKEKDWLRTRNGLASTVTLMQMQMGTWTVCFRPRGGHWRVIPWDLSAFNHTDTLTPKVAPRNYTFAMNDTRAGTYGHIDIIDVPHLKRFTTQRSTYYNFWESTSSVVGSSLKVLLPAKNCWTDDAEPDAASTDPGLPECTILQGNSTPSSSDACEGMFHDSNTPRSLVSHYVRLPRTPGRYMVCFRNKAENWVQLGTLVVTAPPVLKFSLHDKRSGSYGMMLLVADHPQKLDVRPFDLGDVLRFLPNSTATGTNVPCNLVWSRRTSAPSPQLYNPLMTVLDLGVYCPPGNKESAGVCADNTQNMEPYKFIDSTKDAPSVSAAVGFMTLPAATTVYKVCYKQSDLNNWIELDSSVSLRPPQIITRRTLDPVVYAGMMFSLELKTASPYALNLNNSHGDIVKLVPRMGPCDRPAAGSRSYENAHSSITRDLIANSDSRGLADNNINALEGRAIIFAPTESDSLPAHVRVCYMPGGGGSWRNWNDLGALVVQPTGVRYTVPDGQLLARMVLRVEFVSTGLYAFNVSRFGDDAKLVHVSAPCNDVQLGMGTVRTLHDLGPNNEMQSPRAVLEVELPNVVKSTRFKVCYRLYGRPWVEVDSLNNTVDLLVHSVTLPSVNIAKGLRELPSVDGLISGASTTSGLFTVSGNVTAGDKFRILVGLDSRCEDSTAEEFTFEATNIAFHIPFSSGNRTFCYRKPHFAGWLSLGRTSTFYTSPPFVRLVQTEAGSSLRLMDIRSAPRLQESTLVMMVPWNMTCDNTSTAARATNMSSCNGDACVTRSLPGYVMPISIRQRVCVLIDGIWFQATNEIESTPGYRTPYFYTGAALPAVKIVNSSVASGGTVEAASSITLHIELRTDIGLSGLEDTLSVVMASANTGSIESECTVVRGGVASIVFRPLSGCLQSGCAVRVQSTLGLSQASDIFLYFVAPTVAEQVAVDKRTTDVECVVGNVCSLGLLAQTENHTLAYTSSDIVDLTFQYNPRFGLRVECETQSLPDASGCAVVSRGYATARYRLILLDGSAFSSDTTLNITARIRGKNTTTSVNVFVPRRVLGSIVVNSLDAQTLQSHDRPKLYWAPTDGNWSKSAVSASTTSHLIAGDLYKATLSLRDNVGNGLATVELLDNSKRFLTAQLIIGGSANNALRQENSSLILETINITGVVLDVVFRVESCAGCTPTHPCSIRFSTPSGIAATITTPVRCIGSELRATVTRMGTVSTGFDVSLEAVNDKGLRDYYHTGSVVVLADLLEDPNVAVHSIVSNSALAPQLMRGGLAQISAITLRPLCRVCAVYFASSLGASSRRVNVSLPADTYGLQCSWATDLPVVDVKASTIVSSVVLNASSDLTNSGVYITSHTLLSVDVAAVDWRGARTWYETNWVISNIIVVKNTPGVRATLKPAANSSRIAPLERSLRRFSFYIDLEGATKAISVQVEFAAQRFNTFGTYWSPRHGTCRTPVFSVQPAPIPSRLSLQVLPLSEGTAAPIPITPVWSAVAPSTARGVRVSVVDKYGTRAPTYGTAYVVEVTAGKEASLGTNPEDGAFDTQTHVWTFPTGSAEYMTVMNLSTSFLAVEITMSMTTRESVVLAGSHRITVLPPDSARRAVSVRRDAPLAFSTFSSTPSADVMAYKTPQDVYKQNERYFLRGRCDPRTSSGNLGTISNSANTPMRFYVTLSGTSAVDYIQSYNISLTLGEHQTISCVGTPCAGDGTHTVSKVAGVSSSSDVAVILPLVLAFRLSSGTYKTADFIVQGDMVSAQYELGTSGTLFTNQTVSRMGSIGVAATLEKRGTDAVTPFSDTHIFAWRGAGLEATSWGILDTSTAPTCRTDSELRNGGPGLDGYFRESSVVPSVSYLSQAKVGATLPVSVRAYDKYGDIAVGAEASISVYIVSPSATTCTAPQITAPSVFLVDGEATAMVTFLSECNGCQLEFVLQPIRTLSLGIPNAQRRILTRPFNITTPHQSHFVVAAKSGSEPPNIVRVGDFFSLSLNVLTRDATPVAAADLVASVAIHALPDEGSVDLEHRGGALLTYPNTELTSPLEVSFNGRTNVHIAFARPCTSCRLLVVWTLPYSRGTFYVRSQQGTTHFKVTTRPSSAIIQMGITTVSVGTSLIFVERSIDKFRNFDIDSAESTMDKRSPAALSITAASGNGDGGDKKVRTVMFEQLYGVRFWQLQFPVTCQDCVASVSSSSGAFSVQVKATKLFASVASKSQNTLTMNVYACNAAGYRDYGYSSDSLNVSVTSQQVGVTPYAIFGVGGNVTVLSGGIFQNGAPKNGRVVIAFTEPCSLCLVQLRAGGDILSDIIPFSTDHPSTDLVAVHATPGNVHVPIGNWYNIRIALVTPRHNTPAPTATPSPTVPPTTPPMSSNGTQANATNNQTLPPMPATPAPTTVAPERGQERRYVGSARANEIISVFMGTVGCDVGLPSTFVMEAGYTDLPISLNSTGQCIVKFVAKDCMDQYADASRCTAIVILNGTRVSPTHLLWTSLPEGAVKNRPVAVVAEVRGHMDGDSDTTPRFIDVNYTQSIGLQVRQGAAPSMHCVVSGLTSKNATDGRATWYASFLNDANCTMQLTTNVTSPQLVVAPDRNVEVQTPYSVAADRNITHSVSTGNPLKLAVAVIDRFGRRVRGENVATVGTMAKPSQSSELTQVALLAASTTLRLGATVPHIFFSKPTRGLAIWLHVTVSAPEYTFTFDTTPFDVTIVPKRITFLSGVPSHWVVRRPLAVDVGVVDEANDVFPFNIATQRSAFVTMESSVPQSTNMLTSNLTTEDTRARTIRGQGRLVGVYVGGDGAFGLRVSSLGLDPAAVSIMFQSLKGLRIVTEGFNPTAPSTCTTACPLPANVFFGGVLASQTTFSLQVYLSDGAGDAVLGTSEDVIEVSVMDGSEGTPTIGAPDDADSVPYIREKVHRGVANFTLRVFGASDSARLLFRCLTCPQHFSVWTQYFSIGTIPPPSSVLHPSLRINTGLVSIDVVNMTSLHNMVSATLAGVPSGRYANISDLRVCRVPSTFPGIVPLSGSGFQCTVSDATPAARRRFRVLQTASNDVVVVQFSISVFLPAGVEAGGLTADQLGLQIIDRFRTTVTAQGTNSSFAEALQIKDFATAFVQGSVTATARPTPVPTNLTVGNTTVPTATPSWGPDHSRPGWMILFLTIMLVMSLCTV